MQTRCLSTGCQHHKYGHGPYCELHQHHTCRCCGARDSGHRTADCPSKCNIHNCELRVFGHSPYCQHHQPVTVQRAHTPVTVQRAHTPLTVQRAHTPVTVQRPAAPVYANVARQIGMNPVEAMILQRNVRPGQAFVMAGPTGGAFGVAPLPIRHGVMQPQPGFRPAPTNITPQGGVFFLNR